jgi:CRP-like cAMP-binding protein
MEASMVDADTVLVDKGEPGNLPIYIVLEGDLEYVHEDNAPVALHRGAVFGERTLLPTDPVDFTVSTKTSTKLLVLRKEELMDLMSMHIDIVEAMLKILKEGAESIVEETSMDVFV